MGEYCLRFDIEMAEFAVAALDDDNNNAKEEYTLIRQVLSSCYPIVFDEGERVRPIFEELFAEFTLKRLGHMLRVQALLMTLMIDVMRILQSPRGDHPLDRAPASRKEKRIQRILEFIHLNYRHPVSIHDLAKALFLSPKQVNRLMKDELGETFQPYLQKHRIRIAQQLCRQSQLSLEEVAEQAGFSSHL